MDKTNELTQTILYVFDSLRYDYVGCDESGSEIAPHINNLSEDGLSCDRAYSQAIWTYPSSASIFTGLYPESHGSQQFEQPLHDSHPHIGDIFSGSDIPTACFSTTLGVSPKRGFDRGFDEFYHLGKGNAGLRPDIMECLNEELLPWIDDHADSNFFVVVWAMGTHHPYLTPEDVDDPTEPMKNVRGIKGTQDQMRRLSCDQSDEVKDRYRKTVSYSDQKFGELIKKLKEMQIYNDSTIIITSDHGEVFDEHARLEHSPEYRKQAVKCLINEKKRRYFGIFDPSAFIGHQGIYPYNELLHVPLVIKSGDEHSLSGRSDQLVELIDILPTLCDLSGERPPATAQGYSVLDLFSGKESRKYTYSTSELHNGQLKYRSVSDAQNKYCTKTMSRISFDTIFQRRFYESLFGYLVDRREVFLDENEQRISDDISKEFRDELDAHIQRCCNWDTLQNNKVIEVDDKTEQTLSDLGYK